jgi:hypothetical protein
MSPLRATDTSAAGEQSLLCGGKLTWIHLCSTSHGFHHWPTAPGTSVYLAHNPAALLPPGGLPTEDSQALALERARFSRASLEAVLARGPPKDILGRMLFALAQPPPPFSQLKQQPCPAIPGATRFYTVVQV